MPERNIRRNKLKKSNTNIKKVSIYFNDGTCGYGSDHPGDGIGNGNGNGFDAATFCKPRYKHGEILDIAHGFVYFLEDNGRFSLIPIPRIYRVEGDKS
jgi:hypothetical protein